jgi:hypothetical protein
VKNRQKATLVPFLAKIAILKKTRQVSPQIVLGEHVATIVYCLTGPLQKCHQLGRNVCLCQEHATPGALPYYLSFYLLELSIS